MEFSAVAYELLFVEMTRFAIANGLRTIDFGSVLNTTKQRMVNKTEPMSYFMLSKNPFIQWFFRKLLGVSKIQGKEQMKFRDV